MTFTRRQTLLAGSGAIAFLNAATRSARGAGQTDVAVLQGVLELELLVEFAYTQALAAAELSPGTRQLLREVLAHEQAHVSALRSSIRSLGASPAPERPVDFQGLIGASHLPAGSTKPHSEKDWLRVLLTAEGLAEGAHYTAVGKLNDPALMRLAAELLSSEAQHAALLGEHLYHDVRSAVAYAFVQGTR